MDVRIVTLCPKLHLHEGTMHIKKALEDLGFSGKETREDLLFDEEVMWELNSQEVSIGSSKEIKLEELASKLQVFQDVPVTSNEEAVFFTIEDWWM